MTDTNEKSAPCACAYNRDGKRVHECQECAAKRLGPAPAPPPSATCWKCGDPRDVGHEFGFRDHAFVCQECGDEDCNHSAPVGGVEGAGVRMHSNGESGCFATIDALRAEVERLTKALEEIAAVGPHRGEYCDVIARRALRPTHNTGEGE